MRELAKKLVALHPRKLKISVYKNIFRFKPDVRTTGSVSTNISFEKGKGGDEAIVLAKRLLVDGGLKSKISDTETGFVVSTGLYDVPRGKYNKLVIQLAEHLREFLPKKSEGLLRRFRKFLR